MRDSLLIWGLLYESHYENKINMVHGVSKLLHTWLNGFATDGTAAVMGRYRGAGTLLSKKNQF